MMIKKTKGTISSAPGTPRLSSLMAKRDDTAAATMPLGAIQLRNHLSLRFSDVPIPQAQTLRGLAINITTANNANPCQPRLSSALESRRAASKINKTEISSTVSVSLNSMISEISIPRILASTIPITVTVNNPDSSCIRFEPTNTPSMMVSTPAFFR